MERSVVLALESPLQMDEENAVESAVQALDDSLRFRLDLLLQKLFDSGVHDSRLEYSGGHHACSAFLHGRDGDDRPTLEPKVGRILKHPIDRS